MIILSDYAKSMVKTDEELDILNALLEDFSLLSSCNLTDYLPDDSYVTHKEKYFLSSQAKMIMYGNSTKRGMLAYFYNKNGSISQICIDSKEIFDELCKVKDYDEVSLSFDAGMIAFKGLATIFFSKSENGYIVNKFNMKL